MSQAQDVATAEAGEPAGADDEQEAQRAHAADQVRIGAFARARFGRREGVELEAAGEIVGEDTERLPGTVGPVVGGRDDVEGELALEFGQGLLLGAAPVAEGVEGREVQGEVGGDGGVFGVPIVRLKRSSWKFFGLSWATCLR